MNPIILIVICFIIFAFVIIHIFRPQNGKIKKLVFEINFKKLLIKLTIHK